MLASLGAVTRPCHERDEQVRYLVEKLMLFFHMFQDSLPSFCRKFFHQSLSSITFELSCIF